MFYDPPALISPITLSIKLILQKLFELKIDWDNRIDVETNELWNKYIKEFQNVNSFSVNRRVLCCDGNYVQLHGVIARGMHVGQWYKLELFAVMG